MLDFHPHAPSDVHSIALGMLPKIRGRVLDAAAGDGSVSRTMTEMGFQVTSADVHFARPHELPSAVEIDLNGPLPFSDSQFDGVVSIETIEHLENPWAFMRELARITREGGFVIVSTPNVHNMLSRLRMLRDGQLEWFRPVHIYPLGHISPILEYLLDEMAKRAGLVKDQVRFSRSRIPMTQKRVSIDGRFFGECRVTRFIKR